MDEKDIFKYSVLVKSKDDIDLIYGIKKINGQLWILGTNLKDLDGLEKLSEITGSLVIMRNYKLSNINGLRGLKEIGNDALFYYPKNQACLLFAMNCYSIYINLKKFESEQCLTYPK